MPPRDPTGKELSGAAKRRLRAERAHLSLVPGEGPPPPAPPRCRALARAPDGGDSSAEGQPLKVPPLPDTVERAVVWAAHVQAGAARLAALGLDPERVRAVNSVVGALGKLRAYAKDSEDAIVVLKHHLRQEVDVHGAEPPEDAAGLCAWGFWQLVELLQQAATAPLVDESAVGHRARALAQLNHVRPQARLDEIAELLKQQEE